MTSRTLLLHRVGGYYEARPKDSARAVQKALRDATWTGFLAKDADVWLERLEQHGFAPELIEAPGACSLPSAKELDARITALARADR